MKSNEVKEGVYIVGVFWPDDITSIAKVIRRIEHSIIVKTVYSDSFEYPQQNVLSLNQVMRYYFPLDYEMAKKVITRKFQLAKD